jgi:hypothetical protein
MCGKFLTLKELKSLVNEQRGSEDVFLADCGLNPTLCDYYYLDKFQRDYIEATPKKEGSKSDYERKLRYRLKQKIVTKTVPEYHTMLLTLLLAHGYLKHADRAKLERMKEAMGDEQNILVNVIRRWYSEEQRASIIGRLMDKDYAIPYHALEMQKPAMRLDSFRKYLAENEYSEKTLDEQRITVLTELDKLISKIGDDDYYPDLSLKRKDTHVWTLNRLSDRLAKDYAWIIDDFTGREENFHWLPIKKFNDEVNLIFLIQIVSNEMNANGHAARLDDVGKLLIEIGVPVENYEPKCGYGGIKEKLEEIFDQMEERGIVRRFPNEYVNTSYGLELLKLSIRTSSKSRKSLQTGEDLNLNLTAIMKARKHW